MLPDPDPGALPDLADLLTDPPSMYERERLAGAAMATPGWLSRLAAAFRDAEARRDAPALECLYRIVKALVLLNEAGLIEELLSDEMSDAVIGALEYEPGLEEGEQGGGEEGEQEEEGKRASGGGGGSSATAKASSASSFSPRRLRHREFLSRAVAHKEVVPFPTEALRAKVRASYRAAFVRDVALPRALDDGTHATLASLAAFNAVEVLVALQSDQGYLPKLFELLRESSPTAVGGGGRGEPPSSALPAAAAAGDDTASSTSTVWADGAGALQEMVDTARHLQAGARGNLLRRMVSLGLFEVMAKALVVKEEKAEEKKEEATATAAGGAGKIESAAAEDASALPPPLRRRPRPAASVPAPVPPLLRLRAVDVLLSVTAHDPGPLREFLLTEGKGEALMHAIVGAALGEEPGPSPFVPSSAAAGDDDANKKTEEGGGSEKAAAAPESGGDGCSGGSDGKGGGGAGSPPPDGGIIGPQLPAAALAAASAPAAAASEEKAASEEAPAAAPAADDGDSRKGAAATPPSSPSHSSAADAADAAGGLQEAAVELLRALLDPDTMPVPSEQSSFLEAFYEKHVGRLVEALAAAGGGGEGSEGATTATAAATTAAANGDGNKQQQQLAPSTPPPPATSTITPPPPPPAALAAAAELLCFCAAAHSYRMKYFVLRHNVVSRVHTLLQSRRGSWLRLAPLRFVRACVGLRDEFYDRYLARNGLLSPLLEAHAAATGGGGPGGRRNLYDAALLELLEFIRRENVEALVEHLATDARCSSALEKLGAPGIAAGLKLRHAQNVAKKEKERSKSSNRTGGNGTSAVSPSPLAGRSARRTPPEENVGRGGGGIGGYLQARFRQASSPGAAAAADDGDDADASNCNDETAAASRLFRVFAGGGGASRRRSHSRRDERDMDADEEAYFEHDDDGEESGGGGGGSGAAAAAAVRNGGENGGGSDSDRRDRQPSSNNNSSSPLSLGGSASRLLASLGRAAGNALGLGLGLGGGGGSSSPHSSALPLSSRVGGGGGGSKGDDEEEEGITLVKPIVAPPRLRLGTLRGPSSSGTAAAATAVSASSPPGAVAATVAAMAAATSSPSPSGGGGVAGKRAADEDDDEEKGAAPKRRRTPDGRHISPCSSPRRVGIGQQQLQPAAPPVVAPVGVLLGDSPPSRLVPYDDDDE